MFTQFRVHYPNGSLVTELSAIDHGKYIVRCLVQDGGTTLVTGLAAAETVEVAEEQARSRALAILGIDSTATEKKETHPPTPEVIPFNPTLSTPPISLDATAQQSESLTTSQPAPIPDVVDNKVSQLPPVEPTVPTESPVEVSSKTQRRSKREKVAEVMPAPAPPPVVDEIPFAEETLSVEVESFQEAEPSFVSAETLSETSLNDTSVNSYLPSEPETSTSEPAIPSTPIDFSDIIARTNVELKRLGWTNQQGRDYLIQTYGKRSRQLLTDDELLDFLHHLESEPAPDD